MDGCPDLRYLALGDGKAVSEWIGHGLRSGWALRETVGQPMPDCPTIHAVSGAGARVPRESAGTIWGGEGDSVDSVLGDGCEWAESFWERAARVAAEVARDHGGSFADSAWRRPTDVTEQHRRDERLSDNSPWSIAWQHLRQACPDLFEAPPLETRPALYLGGDKKRPVESHGTAVAPGVRHWKRVRCEAPRPRVLESSISQRDHAVLPEGAISTTDGAPASAANIQLTLLNEQVDGLRALLVQGVGHLERPLRAVMTQLRMWHLSEMDMAHVDVQTTCYKACEAFVQILHAEPSDGWMVPALAAEGVLRIALRIPVTPFQTRTEDVFLACMDVMVRALPQMHEQIDRWATTSAETADSASWLPEADDDQRADGDIEGVRRAQEATLTAGARCIRPMLLQCAQLVAVLAEVVAQATGMSEVLLHRACHAAIASVQGTLSVQERMRRCWPGAGVTQCLESVWRPSLHLLSAIARRSTEQAASVLSEAQRLLATLFREPELDTVMALAVPTAARVRLSSMLMVTLTQNAGEETLRAALDALWQCPCRMRHTASEDGGDGAPCAACNTALQHFGQQAGQIMQLVGVYWMELLFRLGTSLRRSAFREGLLRLIDDVEVVFRVEAAWRPGALTLLMVLARALDAGLRMQGAQRAPAGPVLLECACRLIRAAGQLQRLAEADPPNGDLRASLCGHWVRQQPHWLVCLIDGRSEHDWAPIVLQSTQHSEPVAAADDAANDHASAAVAAALLMTDDAPLARLRHTVIDAIPRALSSPLATARRRALRCLQLLLDVDAAPKKPFDASAAESTADSERSSIASSFTAPMIDVVQACCLDVSPQVRETAVALLCLMLAERDVSPASERLLLGRLRDVSTAVRRRALLGVVQLLRRRLGRRSADADAVGDGGEGVACAHLLLRLKDPAASIQQLAQVALWEVLLGETDWSWRQRSVQSHDVYAFADEEEEEQADALWATGAMAYALPPRPSTAAARALLVASHASFASSMARLLGAFQALARYAPGSHAELAGQLVQRLLTDGHALLLARAEAEDVARYLFGRGDYGLLEALGALDASLCTAYAPAILSQVLTHLAALTAADTESSVVDALLPQLRLLRAALPYAPQVLSLEGGRLEQALQQALFSLPLSAERLAHEVALCLCALHQLAAEACAEWSQEHESAAQRCARALWAHLAAQHSEWTALEVNAADMGERVATVAVAAVRLGKLLRFLTHDVEDMAAPFVQIVNEMLAATLETARAADSPVVLQLQAPLLEALLQVAHWRRECLLRLHPLLHTVLRRAGGEHAAPGSVHRGAPLVLLEHLRMMLQAQRPRDRDDTQGRRDDVDGGCNGFRRRRRRRHQHQHRTGSRSRVQPARRRFLEPAPDRAADQDANVVAGVVQSLLPALLQYLRHEAPTQSAVLQQGALLLEAMVMEGTALPSALIPKLMALSMAGVECEPVRSEEDAVLLPAVAAATTAYEAARQALAYLSLRHAEALVSSVEAGVREAHAFVWRRQRHSEGVPALCATTLMQRPPRHALCGVIDLLRRRPQRHEALRALVSLMGQHQEDVSHAEALSFVQFVALLLATLVRPLTASGGDRRRRCRTDRHVVLQALEEAGSAVEMALDPMVFADDVEVSADDGELLRIRRALLIQRLRGYLQGRDAAYAEGAEGDAATVDPTMTTFTELLQCGAPDQSVAAFRASVAGAISPGKTRVSRLASASSASEPEDSWSASDTDTPDTSSDEDQLVDEAA